MSIKKSTPKNATKLYEKKLKIGSLLIKVFMSMTVVRKAIPKIRLVKKNYVVGTNSNMN